MRERRWRSRRVAATCAACSPLPSTRRGAATKRSPCCASSRSTPRWRSAGAASGRGRGGGRGARHGIAAARARLERHPEDPRLARGYAAAARAGGTLRSGARARSRPGSRCRRPTPACARICTTCEPRPVRAGATRGIRARAGSGAGSSPGRRCRVARGCRQAARAAPLRHHAPGGDGKTFSLIAENSFRSVFVKPVDGSLRR